MGRFEEFTTPLTVPPAAIGSAMDGNPEAAGKALTLGKETGTPPAIIKADPEGFERTRRVNDAVQFGQSPEIASYMGSDPLHAEVSSDDYDKLNTFSKNLKALTSGTISGIRSLGALPNALARDKDGNLLPIDKESFAQGLKLSDLTAPFSKLAPKLLYGLGNSAPSLGGALVGGVGGGAIAGLAGPEAVPFGSVAGMAIGGGAVAAAQSMAPYYQQAIQSGANPDQAFDKALHAAAVDGVISGISMAAFGWSPFRSTVKNALTQALTVQPGIAAGGKVVQNLLAGQPAGEGMESALLSGSLGTLTNPLMYYAMRNHTVPHGVDPTVDTLRVEQSKIDADALDRVMASAEESKTHERAPSAFEAFAKTHEPGTISIPAEKVKEVYDAAGIRPSYGDHLFGYIPDIGDKIGVALDTGDDIHIPLASYVAYTSEELHNQVKDDIRVRPEGLTRNEIAEQKETVEGGDKVEETPKEEVKEPEKGFVRFYHGGPPEGFNYNEPTSGGGRWVTPDLNYARGYRSVEGKTGRVWYVDIPEDNPLLRKAFDDTGTDMKAPYISFEAPEEFAKQMKRVEPGVKAKPAEKEASTSVEAIANAEKQGMHLSPLFPDAKSAGMTEADFTRYNRLIQKTETDLVDRATRAASREIAKRQTAEWKANEAKTREEVSTDLRYNPDLMADRYLRTGDSPQSFLEPGMKLNRDQLVARYGDEVLKELPANAVKKGGVSPDDIAPAFGFSSGEAMVNRLRMLESARKTNGETAAQHLERITREETAKRMEAQYGDLGENIFNEAREAALSQVHVEVLSDELKALAAVAGGDPPMAREKLEAWVKEVYDRTTIDHARDVDHFQRTVGKEGLKAEQALLRGKFVEAFQAKQRQLLSFLIAREAQAFDREMTKAERQFAWAAKNLNPKGVEQGYMDQVHRVLDQIGWGNRRNDAELQRALEGKSLEKFIDGKNAEGWPIQAADFLKDGSWKSNYNDLTVERFRDVRDTVDSLIHTGKLEQTVMIGDQRETYENAVAKVLKNLDDLKKVDFDPREKGFISNIRSASRNVDAVMIKMEQLFDWIDKRNPFGVMNQAVFRPLSEAEHWKLDTLKSLSKEIRQLPKVKRGELRESINNTDLLDPKTGEPMKMDRESMLSVALNMGNQSNAQKLLRGWGWDVDSVKNFLDKNMTDKDIAYVNGVWKVLSNLRPKVDEVTRRLTGIGVDLIDGAPMQLSKGKLDGGYYPLIEDRFYGINRKPVSKDIMDDPSFQPLPTAQAVKNRTGAQYPLALVLDSLPGRIAETVHYLAFREPMLNARKLLSDPLVREGVSDAFGPEYTQQLEPWLRHIATDGGIRDETGNHWLASLSRFARMNVQAMYIGLNPITAFVHGGSAAMNSIQEIGLRPFLNAAKGLPTDLFERTINNFFKNPQSQQTIHDFVMEKSGEVRNRKLKLDDNILRAFEKSIGKSTLREAYQQHAHFMVASLDMASAIPTWKAVYDHEIMNGTGEQDAIYAADKAVRNAHGASGLTDVPSIQRGPEWQKWWTMFMGYFAHNYNRIRDTSRIAAGDEPTVQTAMNDESGKWGLVASRTALYLTLPALWHFMFRGERENKDWWGEWAAEAVLSQAAGGLPIVRDTVYAMLHHRDVSNPLADMLNGIIKPIEDVGSALGISHQKVSNKWVEHMLDAPGWVMGLSSKQIGRTGQFLYDYKNGKEQPGNPWEFARGLIYGHAKEKKR